MIKSEGNLNNNTFYRENLCEGNIPKLAGRLVYYYSNAKVYLIDEFKILIYRQRTEKTYLLSQFFVSARKSNNGTSSGIFECPSNYFCRIRIRYFDHISTMI